MILLSTPLSYSIVSCWTEMTQVCLACLLNIKISRKPTYNLSRNNNIGKHEKNGIRMGGKVKSKTNLISKKLSLSTPLSYSIVSHWTEMTLESDQSLTLYSNKQKTYLAPCPK